MVCYFWMTCPQKAFFSIDIKHMEPDGVWSILHRDQSPTLKDFELAVKSQMKPNTWRSPHAKCLTTLLLCFMSAGSVQSVQVLLQLVLLALGLLSICRGATLRCTLHLLGPSGMCHSALLPIIVYYRCQSVTFLALNLCLGQFWWRRRYKNNHICKADLLLSTVRDNNVLKSVYFNLQGLVLIITIMREAVEEIRCYLRDKEVNSQIYSKLSTRGEDLEPERHMFPYPRRWYLNRVALFSRHRRLLTVGGWSC